MWCSLSWDEIESILTKSDIPDALLPSDDTSLQSVDALSSDEVRMVLPSVRSGGSGYPLTTASRFEEVLQGVYAHISTGRSSDSLSNDSDSDKVQLVSNVASVRSGSPASDPTSTSPVPEPTPTPVTSPSPIEKLLQEIHLPTPTTTKSQTSEKSNLLTPRRRTENSRIAKYGWKKEPRPDKSKLFWYIHKSGKRVGSLKKVMSEITYSIKHVQK